MLKFFTFIGFFLIYLVGYGQKAFYYQDKLTELNRFDKFYLLNNPLNLQELTSPFLKKPELKGNGANYFILYNEVGLKNLYLSENENLDAVLLMNLYEGSSFDGSVKTPIDYKQKKIKGRFLILDILNSSNRTLVWRGWIDLKKVKSVNPYQKAIYLILANFQNESLV